MIVPHPSRRGRHRLRPHPLVRRGGRERFNARRNRDGGPRPGRGGVADGAGRATDSIAGAGATGTSVQHRRQESPCPHPVPPPWPTPSSSPPGRRRPTRWPRPGCPPPARRRSSWSATPQGRLRDLDWTPAEETAVEPVAIDSPDGLNVLRHSTAHVLAQAVQDVFPEAKLGIGPPIENGFYYDFDVAKPFQPDDLGKLEKRMQEIIKSGQRFRRRRFATLDEAQGRAGRRAVQAGADRRQGRGAGHRRGDGGGRRRADHLRQPRRRTRTRSAGRTCAAARTCRPPG